MAEDRFVIGVDVGTQSAKVMIFAAFGEVVAEGHQALRPLEIPAPNRAVHPDDDLWDGVVAAIREAVASFVVAGHEVASIEAMGICIIRCCRALLRADGTLAHPVINWMDERLDHPHAHEDQYGEVSHVTTSSGYIGLRLTGQRVDTSANLIGWWPINDLTHDWSEDPEQWTSCNLHRDQVFDLVRPGERIGGLTPDAASLPGQHLYECWGVRRGMWSVSWFRDEFGAAAVADAAATGVPVEELLNAEAAHVPVGSDGLLTIHDWAAPPHAPYRKGALIGFDGRHTRGHLYRSLLEGIALRLKTHMDPMAAELQQPFTHLIVSGGGANSDVMMQILADVHGVPATRNRLRSSAAIGCAVNAGLYAGIWSTPTDATNVLVERDDTFEPVPAHTAHYARMAAIEASIHEHLDPVTQAISALDR